MIQENEFAAMLIGLWVLLYSRKIKFTQFPEYKYFFSGFYCLLASWVATVLETFFWSDYLNFAEHFLYTLSSAILLFWCFRSFIFRRKT